MPMISDQIQIYPDAKIAYAAHNRFSPGEHHLQRWYMYHSWCKRGQCVFTDFKKISGQNQGFPDRQHFFYSDIRLKYPDS